jgi:hypothetical protein
METKLAVNSLILAGLYRADKNYRWAQCQQGCRPYYIPVQPSPGFIARLGCPNEEQLCDDSYKTTIGRGVRWKASLATVKCFLITKNGCLTVALCTRRNQELVINCRWKYETMLTALSRLPYKRKGSGYFPSIGCSGVFRDGVDFDEAYVYGGMSNSCYWVLNDISGHYNGKGVSCRSIKWTGTALWAPPGLVVPRSR